MIAVRVKIASVYAILVGVLCSSTVEHGLSINEITHLIDWFNMDGVFSNSSKDGIVITMMDYCASISTTQLNRISQILWI